MTKQNARRGKKRNRAKEWSRVGAWTLLGLIELAVAALPTAIAAVILVAITHAQRGYAAFGGEWLVIAAVFCVTFTIVHNRVCDELFKGGKHE